MLQIIIRRLLVAIVVILGVSAAVFTIIRLTGDPLAFLLSPAASQEDARRLRELLGLDRGIPVQFWRFLTRVGVGDFGRSFLYDEPALGIVLERVPATVELGLTAFVLTVCLGLPLGEWSVRRQETLPDYVASLLTAIGQSVPNFWLGTMLILLLAVEVRWFPTAGRGTAWHLVLPALTLACQPISRLARLTRSELLDTLGRDYIRTARAKGSSEWAVYYRHALKNVAIALVTILGLDLGYLLGGTVIVETVFGWPGVGRLLIEAVSRRDFPVVQAAVFLIACLVVVINFVTDVLYAALDPQVRVT
jgi:peptide/nickel transport system permease protein